MNETGFLAALFDPALASPINTVLIVFEFAYLVNELSKLRGRSEAHADEALRLARGSESRAVNAAAEITALSRHVEQSLSEVVVTSRAVRDRLGLLRHESQQIDEKLDEMSRSWPHAAPEGPR